MFPSPFARLFGIKSTSFANEQYRNQGNKATGKRNCYQKVIICPSAPRRLIFDYCGAIFALPGDALLWLAQNIHVFLRKSPLFKEHFFEWLKTENLSNACGRGTLKSPPSRGSDAPHVHPRLRKRLARCTLDCGFKTPESPALRGFEAERGPIKGTSRPQSPAVRGFPRF